MLLALISLVLTTILLYLSSHSLIKNLIKLFYRLSHSHSTAVNLLFFLFLPGIFLHEFAHILAAELLQVPTGHLHLKPQYQDGQLRLGSAQIAQTDPLRLSLIGTFPFILGTFILWLLLRFALNIHLSSLTLTNLIPQLILAVKQLPLLSLLAIIYLLSAIANTMFSSPSDLQSAGLPVILLIIILTTLKLAHITLPFPFSTYLINLFFLLSTIFSLTLFLNLILLLPLKLLNRR